MGIRMVPHVSRQTHFTGQVHKENSDMGYPKKIAKDKLYSLRNSGFKAASVNQDPQAVSALLGKTSCVHCMKIAVLPGENRIIESLWLENTCKMISGERGHRTLTKGKGYLPTSIRSYF